MHYTSSQNISASQQPAPVKFKRNLDCFQNWLWHWQRIVPLSKGNRPNNMHAELRICTRGCSTAKNNQFLYHSSRTYRALLLHITKDNILRVIWMKQQQPCLDMGRRKWPFSQDQNWVRVWIWSPWILRPKKLVTELRVHATTVSLCDLSSTELISLQKKHLHFRYLKLCQQNESRHNPCNIFL